MLVLARREGEKIVFPNLGVTLEVVRIKGNTARLGIDAPSNVAVLRHELLKRDGAAAPPSAGAARQSRGLPHEIRNRVHAATLGVYLFRRQLENGLLEDAERSFTKILAEFNALEKILADYEAAKTGAQPLARIVETAARPRMSAQRSALVVEDDANECELLAGFLRISGFRVATAGDGADALGYLSSHDQPDVVLLDMFMPRFDGPSTVDAIRDNPQFRGMKLFALSGTCPAELGVTTGPHGVDRWFPKPVNPEALVQEITRELEVSTA